MFPFECIIMKVRRHWSTQRIGVRDRKGPDVSSWEQTRGSSEGFCLQNPVGECDLEGLSRCETPQAPGHKALWLAWIFPSSQEAEDTACAAAQEKPEHLFPPNAPCGPTEKRALPSFSQSDQETHPDRGTMWLSDSLKKTKAAKRHVER